MKAIRFTVLILLAGISLAIGCAAHRTVAPGQVAAPITLLEQANSDNAQISVHNQAVAKALIAAFQQGLVEKEYFDAASRLQIQITRSKEELSTLLQSQNTAVGAIARIKQIVSDVTAAGSKIVQDGHAGIKNPQTQALVASEVNAIGTLANAILTSIQSLQGGGK